MKSYVYENILLNSFESELFLIIVENIKTQDLCFNIYFGKSCRLLDNMENVVKKNIVETAI